MSPRKTVFLDRDGVLNKRLMDTWVTSLDQLEILPGVPEAVAKLNRAGFRTVVVSNQRGLAIGQLTWFQLGAVNDAILAAVEEVGGRLEAFYYCPHDRHEGCACRKPEPGLLDQAHEDEPVLWPQSYLVGDRDSDIAAGLARGVRTIKVLGPSRLKADFVCADLPEAVSWILSRDQANS